MKRESPDSISVLWRAWREAAAVPVIDTALRSLYAELDAEVAAKGPTCWASGKCCKFDDFGHRLYVTGLEIAWFLTQCGEAEGRNEVEATRGNLLVSPGESPPNRSLDDLAESRGGVRLVQMAEHAGACPYQIDGLCSTHTIRPLGCRVFFCQQGTEAWQQDLYEAFLKRLRMLHESHTIEYRYMDWIAGLSESAGVADDDEATV